MLFPEKTKGYYLLLNATSYGKCASSLHLDSMYRLCNDWVSTNCVSSSRQKPSIRKKQSHSQWLEGPAPVRDPVLIKYGMMASGPIEARLCGNICVSDDPENRRNIWGNKNQTRTLWTNNQTSSVTKSRQTPDALRKTRRQRTSYSQKSKRLLLTSLPPAIFKIQRLGIPKDALPVKPAQIPSPDCPHTAVCWVMSLRGDMDIWRVNWLKLAALGRDRGAVEVGAGADGTGLVWVCWRGREVWSEICNSSCCSWVRSLENRLWMSWSFSFSSFRKTSTRRVFSFFSCSLTFLGTSGITQATSMLMVITRFCRGKSHDTQMYRWRWVRQKRWCTSVAIKHWGCEENICFHSVYGNILYTPDLVLGNSTLPVFSTQNISYIINIKEYHICKTV